MQPRNTVRGRRPAKGEPVIDRGLSLLAAFSEGNRLLSLSELARRAGLPTSTTLRLATRLVEWGALERNEDGSFMIGLRLWEIGSLAPRGIALRHLALPFMTDLAEISHENVMLGVLDGSRALLIERISGHQAVPVIFDSTDSLPLHSTSIGHVLLAHADPEFQESMLAQPMILGPEKAQITSQEMRRRLATVRREGFCLLKRLTNPTITSIAAPITDRHNRVSAALSVVSHSDSTDPRTLVPAVRSAARAISRAWAMEQDRRIG